MEVSGKVYIVSYFVGKMNVYRISWESNQPEKSQDVDWMNGFCTKFHCSSSDF